MTTSAFPRPLVALRGPLLALAAAALLLPAVPSRAPAADTNLTTQILPQTAAPISIDMCQGYLHQDGGFVDEDADFTNHSPQAVTAVRLLFEYYSPFGNRLGSQYGTITGSWKPNASVKGNGWQSANQWASVYAVRCSIDAIKFQDGTTWIAQQPAPAASSSAASAASGSAPAHPATCNVELIDKTRIDIPWGNAGCAKARAAWSKAHPAAASK